MSDAADERERAWNEFQQSGTYRLILNTHLLNEGACAESIDCVWKQGFNDGLSVALSVLDMTK